MANPIPLLPSPLFELLTPEKFDQLGRDRLPAIFQAIESGAWAMDPNEIHPVTGLTLFQSIARSQKLLDTVQAELLSFMARRGADLEAAPASPADGMTAWEWAMRDGSLELAGLLEQLGAKVPKGRFNSRQSWVIQELRKTRESFQVLTAPKVALEAGVFETLDAKVGGLPLGMLVAERHLQVNGASLAGEPGTTDKKDVSQRKQYLERTGHLVSSLKTLGQRAIELEPGSNFPVWCWVAQCQALAHEPEGVPVSHGRRWAGAWRSFEKSLLARYGRGVDPLQAQAMLAEEVVAMGREVMLGLAGRLLRSDPARVGRSGMPEPVNALRDLQRVAAYLMASMRGWASRIDPGVDDWSQVRAVRERAVFDLAAALVSVTPKQAWEDEDFSSSWRSAAYYALSPGVHTQLREDRPMPEWVGAPWSTLPLLVSGYQPLPFLQDDAGRPEEGRLWTWLTCSPSTPDDIDLALAMNGDLPVVQARLRTLLLDERLEPAPDKTSPSSRIRF